MRFISTISFCHGMLVAAGQIGKVQGKVLFPDSDISSPIGFPTPPTGPIYGPPSPPSFTPKPTPYKCPATTVSSDMRSCAINSDCNHVCNAQGCCVKSPTIKCPCKYPKKIPDRCEVDILINIMEAAVLQTVSLLGQWTRAGFHDAGTYDQTLNEGGANGCLMNDPAMQTMPENDFFHHAINALKDVKKRWHNHSKTCINVSSADMIQFAILFATVRQTKRDNPVQSPGLSAAKRSYLLNNASWGRPDEDQCEPLWADNLPGFKMGSGESIDQRCLKSGEEIKKKMMDRNGFTAEEATALIGAHTIGTMRGIFGVSHIGSWSFTGHDGATPSGPSFDNDFFVYLIYHIQQNNAIDFMQDVDPFEIVFDDWFKDITPTPPINQLDTDIALAFPSLDTNLHPDFSIYSIDFANENDLFIDTFFKALDKMSKLGVNVELFPASTKCDCKMVYSKEQLSNMDDFAYALLSADELLDLGAGQGQATVLANSATAAIQATRRDEIIKLTTPLNVKGDRVEGGDDLKI